MKILLLLALIVTSNLTYAEIKCDAKNLYPAIPRTEEYGIINYDIKNSFISYFVENKQINIFSKSAVCGQNITTSSPTPVCRFVSESNGETIRYSIHCDQNNRWYSVGIFQLNTSNGRGTFDCSTARNKNLRYDLSNCLIENQNI